MDLNKLSLHVEDVQEALDEGEIELGTANSVREVLDALDDLLVREASMNNLVNELRQNVWDQSVTIADLNRDLNTLKSEHGNGVDHLAASHDRLRNERDSLVQKVENQANTIKVLIGQRDFHAHQLTGIAMLLKARM